MKIIDDFIQKKTEPLRKEIKGLKKENTKLSKLIQPTEKQDDYDRGWNTVGVYNNQISAPIKARDLAKEYVEWVYANISKVAIAVSEIDLKLIQAKGDNVDEVTEHPLLDLINRPNPFTVKSDFMRLMTTYLVGSGESPIRLKRKNPNNLKEIPSEMWVADPSKLVVKVGKTNFNFETLVGYELGQGKDKVELNPWEIIFINTPNPSNPWRGIGLIEAAARTISLQNNSEEYNINFFGNAARPDVVMYTDQKLTQDIIERLKNNWRSNYEGVKNAHKTAVLEAGLKIEKIQSSAKDMDFIEQQKFNRDKLMALSGTTKVILGVTEDVNRANAEASEYVYMKYTIKPIMTQITEYLNEYLLPVFDNTGTMFLTYENPVSEDQTQKTAYYSAAVNRWKTINEIRAEEGDTPIEGGDQLIMTNPNNNEPVQQLSITPMTKEKILAKKYQKDIIKLKNRNIRRKQIVEKIKKELLKGLETKSVYKVKYKDIKKKDTVDLFIKEVLTKQDKHEKTLSSQAREVYEWQENEIVKNLTKGKSASDYMFDETQSIKTGIDLMTPVIEAILLDQGEEAFTLLNISKPYSLLEDARKYLSKTPRKFAKSMTETAYKRARGIIADGLNKGLSITEIAKNIKLEYNDIKKYQAENLARTETSRATGFAQIDAYKQSGFVEGKKWVVTPDDRLCEFCMAMEGEYESRTEQGLSDPFFKLGDVIVGAEGGTLSVDYSDINFQPLHNNCRCVVLPILEPLKKVEPPKKKEKKSTEELLEEVERAIHDHSRD